MRKYLYLFVSVMVIHAVSAMGVYESPQVSKKRDYIGEIEPDFETFPFIFDTLSSQDKLAYVEKIRQDIPDIVYENFDKYSEFSIQEGDYVFDILVTIDVKEVKREAIPLYMYIMWQVHGDGEIGEMLSGMNYDIFLKYPGYFYQYLTHYKQTEFAKYKGVLFCIIFEIVAGSNEAKLDDIISIQKERLPQYIDIIEFTKKYIIDHLDDI